jgi:hypothetical protein
MEIQLIKGQFPCNDAMEILSQMIQVKIKYHEDKIELSSNEEDIKYRETRLKNLQAELALVRSMIAGSNEPVSIHAVIQVEINTKKYETKSLTCS